MKRRHEKFIARITTLLDFSMYAEKEIYVSYIHFLILNALKNSLKNCGIPYSLGFKIYAKISE